MKSRRVQRLIGRRDTSWNPRGFCMAWANPIQAQFI
jgi:hypothetical protein